jgi:hypothetical protein
MTTSMTFNVASKEVSKRLKVPRAATQTKSVRRTREELLPDFNRAGVGATPEWGARDTSR